MSFCIWFIFLSITLSRFIHAVTCIVIPFSFKIGVQACSWKKQSLTLAPLPRNISSGGPAPPNGHLSFLTTASTKAHKDAASPVKGSSQYFTKAWALALSILKPTVSLAYIHNRRLDTQLMATHPTMQSRKVNLRLSLLNAWL